MKVQKRNSTLVDFDKSSIIRAVENAMLETKDGVDTKLSYDIANKIESIGLELYSVENIQDFVEDMLMESNRKDVAKRYIIYRNQRDKTRKNKVKGLLSEEFISKYKHLPSPMNQLGSFVYYRTYSRYLPEEQRREYWWETVKRAVEYNCGLVPTSREEAEKLYDNMFYLRQFLSGRTLYIGGTLVSEKFPTSNYNCSFAVIDNFEAFKDAFYLLMIGSGFGFRILKDDVAKLPRVKTNVEVIHKAYSSVSRDKREDSTSIQFTNNNMVKIIVGDSKGGWVQALDYFLKMLWDKDFIDIKTIVFDYDNVRPKGERLKTFGGTASGYESLKSMFAKVDKIIKKEGTNQVQEKIKLKPINCMDILNAIGENVVIGGVRRCLPKGSLVHTENGLIPIEQVKINDMVMTSKGYAPVTDWVYQGVQELLTINTQMGEFKCTPKHKIAIMNNVNSYEWIYAKDLKENDRMVFVSKTIDGIKTELPEYHHVRDIHDTTSVDIVIPELNEDTAWFLGYLHGNGHVSKRAVSVSIPSTKPNIREKVYKIFESFGIIAHDKPTKGKWFNVEAKSTQLAEYLSQYKKPNVEIIIPNIILQGEINIRESYLTGLYDADGSTKNHPVIALSSVYPNFTKQVQSLFSSIGIPSRFKLKRKTKGKWKDLYNLLVIGEKAKKDFECRIAIKSLKYENCCKTNRSQNDYGYPADWVKNMKTSKIWNKDSRQMTVSTFERISGENQELIPVEVLSISYNKELQETYDISVESTKEFVCEGMLVHNTSEISLIGSDDEECIKAKSNLYKQSPINGKWEIDTELSHRQMSNNSIYYKEKPSREQIHWQIEQMRYSGEPAFVNEIAGNKRRPNFNGVNPCFTGDMNLLTSDGYRTFKELDGKEVSIVNLNGDVSNGKVWCNGEKDIVEVQLSNNRIIKCTPDHILMLDNGKECEAKDCLNKELSAYYGKNPTVISINILEKQKVYDFSEPETNWGIVENVVAHNCAEILLDSCGLCNLTTVNVFAFVIDGLLDIKSLLEAQRLSARSGYRMTCVELELPKWDAVQKRDRLTGCSLTGWQDMVNATGINKIEEAELLRKLRQTAHDEINTYAKELGLPVSLLITTVKPEGTLSKIPGVSSGVHYSQAPWYIIRVRINAHDPLVKVCEELNYPIFPENGQEWETCTTKVIEFPVKSPIGKTKFDVSAIEQLEDYKMFMDNYVDHNASITVTVRDNEWEQVEDWIWNNWDDVVAVSFLSLSDSFYQLMPQEAITEKEYNKRVSEMKTFIPSLISKYELVETEFDIGNDGECSSGVCPIR